MEIDFDPDKDAANFVKHGVPLAFGLRIWADDSIIVLPTERIEDNERRYRAIGMVDGRLWTAVHVYREQGVRMISVRKSNDGERKLYDRA